MMFRRLTIGLRFSQREAWVGGLYYVRNLVKAFALLPPGRRPRLVLIGADKVALAELKAATGYDELTRISRTRIARAPPRRLPFAAARDRDIDLILLDAPPGLEDRAVLWIPDLQEHAFPQFFAAEELEARLRRAEARLAGGRHVMVSSEDVAEGVARIYGRLGPVVHVVRFASFFDPPADLAGTRARYGVPERYLICSNQVWKHKNHPLVLRALAELQPGGPPMVFTGQEEEPRDPAYPAVVWSLAAELGLEDRVLRLGFLPRQDQLALMAGAVAVVQPSLSEGWSTVVEDAKALGRPVIASDIPVHREQLGARGAYFPPTDHRALARLIERAAAHPPKPLGLDYEAARRRFARDLWRMALAVDKDLRRRRVPRLVIGG